jgi:hypothetical protein
MIASAVGGFALSQYLMSWRNGDRDALRAELRAELEAKLKEIAGSAVRLEQARSKDHPQAEPGLRSAEISQQAEEGATGSIVVSPCKPGSLPRSGPKPECSEQGAVRVAVCARVPAAATIKEVLLYTRLEDSQQPWPDSRVQAGQDAGQAKFVEKFYERPDIDGSKQVCQGFAHWNGEKSRLARILVKYAL